MLRAAEKLDDLSVAQIGSGNMKPEDSKQAVAAIRRIAQRGHQPSSRPQRPKLSERIVKKLETWLG